MRQSELLCHFGPFFALLSPTLPVDPENQNFEKMKKTPGGVILHMCTKNRDHMMYAS